MGRATRIATQTGLSSAPGTVGPMRRQEKADRIGEILDDLYPEPPMPLDHTDAYTLLVAVALSAQTTDKTVSYTHLTLPTMLAQCRSRWSPYH